MRERERERERQREREREREREGELDAPASPLLLMQTLVVVGLASFLKLQPLSQVKRFSLSFFHLRLLRTVGTKERKKERRSEMERRKEKKRARERGKERRKNTEEKIQRRKL